MKKEGIFLLFSLVLLGGCANGNPSTYLSNDSNSSVIESTSNEELNNDTSLEDAWNHNWSKEIYDVVKEIMDPDEIPSIIANEISASIEVDEASSLPYAYIVFDGGFNVDSIITTYESKLKAAGYTLSSEADYGFKEYNLTTDAVVQYEVVESRFELTAYLYESRTTEWPAKYIYGVLGYDIPVYQSVTYEPEISYLSGSGYYISMLINKVTADCCNKYTDILRAEGYEISINSDVYIATHKEKEIQLTYMYEEVSNDMFLKIQSISAWPISDIYFFVGEHLPRYTEYSLSEYLYFQGTSGEVLALYFDNSSDTGLTTYGNQLIAAGWELSEDESNVYYKTVDGTLHSVQLVYSESRQCFVIGIY